MTSWYYVEGKDRVGPVEEPKLRELLQSGALDSESYIWTKGFDNWKKFHEVEELGHLLGAEVLEEAPSQSSSFNWKGISKSEKIFMIKIGIDRGTQEVEYGPYDLDELVQAFSEKRINEKTLIYVPGQMKEWIFLADVPIYESLFNTMPPVIDEIDRRKNLRKPFVARMFFHDHEDFFEGVCRDISIGGLQILVSNFPGSVGEEVSMNVHPDNSDYCFTAKGEIVRLLDGGQGFSLRFIELNNEAKSSIESYVNRG
ncbi:GYF domain-containing protein [Halobacteriovorax sp. JY17]|uniref:GYF domain-containing protein n=1 Tax=Halobacteriovorax sp. JY17 TaxID=2014617 RepID=UPI000C5FBA6A|nr:GYF domain-containing protein [Halobacteriovorax sp. JY17]PIK16480.1 MAG: hypothetical protein CES88_07000 [Halobacteriovorax sp. JY17]